MQAITITYKGPTATRGSRWVAKCSAGAVTVPYDHELDSEGNARAAALALLVKLGWTFEAGYKGHWTLGGLWQGPYVAVYSGTALDTHFRAP